MARLKTQLIASVDKDLDEQLRHHAQLESRTLSYFVNDALRDYLKIHATHSEQDLYEATNA